jgi:hypothetical protein
MYLMLGNAQKRRTWTLKLPQGPTYYWDVQAIDGAYLASRWNGTTHQASETVSTSNEMPMRSVCRVLSRMPARSEVRFELSLSKATRVRITVYDVLGRCVGVCSDGEYAEGKHDVVWGAEKVLPGVYVALVDLDGERRGYRLVTMR